MKVEQLETPPAPQGPITPPEVIERVRANIESYQPAELKLPWLVKVLRSLRFVLETFQLAD